MLTVKSLLRRIAGLRVPQQANQLFGDRGFHTQAAGYSHARFAQNTNLANHLNRAVLSILDECQVPYVVFAGALVGWKRDGCIPLWSDDIDIMIFEEALVPFNALVIPKLEAAGFAVHPTTDWMPDQPFGGYAVLGAARADHSLFELAITRDQAIQVPRSQVDVFVSRIEKDRVRNVGSWGRYHRKALPRHVVLPSSFISIDGVSVPSYNNPSEGVRIEYGNVTNIVSVYSHHESSRQLTYITPSWAYFQRRLNRALASTVESRLPGGPPRPLQVQPGTPVYASSEHESLETIFASLQSGRNSRVRLAGDNILWALDLKAWFPGISILFSQSNEENGRLALQLRDQIEGID